MELSSRDEMLQRAKQEEFDLLVVGGGATGAGVALDAASRGLKTALVEANDFGSGTSSRSTKLFHGGIRYLEQAFKQLSYAQFNLVKHALEERYVLLKLAPHLTRTLPIVIPVYSYIKGAYYWAGVKLYDKLAGKRCIGKSQWISANSIKKYFPQISEKGLKGGVLFYDGQFDDSRMNLSLILTAISYGAIALNYSKLISFHHNNGKIVSAHIQDALTDEKWSIKAKHFVNAAGPAGDVIRRLDDPSCIPMLAPSRGTHLVLEGSYVQEGKGLIVPKTEDGRLLFMLPWHGKSLVGTTDVAVSSIDDVDPSEEEKQYLLRHLEKYLGIVVEPSRIEAVWAGLRPLLETQKSGKSSEQVRDFHVLASSGGLISILGGKWTSYRIMAEKTVDEVILKAGFEGIQPCKTSDLLLEGASRYNIDYITRIKQDTALDIDIVDNLLTTYGDKTHCITELAKLRLVERLSAKYPYIWAQVAYACKFEYACTADDILSRRIPLAQVDQKEASAIYPKVKECLDLYFKNIKK